MAITYDNPEVNAMGVSPIDRSKMNGEIMPRETLGSSLLKEKQELQLQSGKPIINPMASLGESAVYSQETSNPERAWYQSKYDDKINWNYDPLGPNDLSSKRAEAQGAWGRLKDSTINNVTILGTTLASDVISLTGGLLSSIIQGDISKMWDNKAVNALSDFQRRKLEERQIFRTQEYENQSAFRRLGSGIFWAELWQNAGYMEGMLIPGMAMGKLAQASKLLANAPKIVTKIGANSIAAIGEASMEALNQKKDSEKDLYAKADRLFREKLANAQNWDEKERLYDEYGKDLKQIQSDVVAIGNRTFAGNVALLTATGTFEFGDFVSRGYAESHKLLQQIARNEAGQAVWKSAFNAVARGLGQTTKNFFAEGFEEYAQRSLASGAARTKKANGFLEKYQDELNIELADNYMSAFFQDMYKDLGSTDAWTEFLSGALMGGIGIPGSHNGAYANIHDALKENQKIEKIANEVNMFELENEISSKDLRNNGKAQAYFDALIREAGINAVQNQALIDRDKKKFVDTRVEKVLNMAYLYDNIGEIDEFKKRLEWYSKIENDEQLEQLKESTREYNNDKTQVLKDSPFADMSIEEVNQKLKETNEFYQKIIDDYIEGKNFIDDFSKGKLEDDTLKRGAASYAQAKSFKKRAAELYKGVNENINKYRTSIISKDDESEDGKFINMLFDGISNMQDEEILPSFSSTKIQSAIYALGEYFNRNSSRFDSEVVNNVLKPLVDLANIASDYKDADNEVKSILKNAEKERSVTQRILDKIKNIKKNYIVRKQAKTLMNITDKNQLEEHIKKLPEEIRDDVVEYLKQNGSEVTKKVLNEMSEWEIAYKAIKKVIESCDPQKFPVYRKSLDDKYTTEVVDEVINDLKTIYQNSTSISEVYEKLDEKAKVMHDSMEGLNNANEKAEALIHYNNYNDFKDKIKNDINSYLNEEKKEDKKNKEDKKKDNNEKEESAEEGLIESQSGSTDTSNIEVPEYVSEWLRKICKLYNISKTKDRKDRWLKDLENLSYYLNDNKKIFYPKDKIFHDGKDINDYIDENFLNKAEFNDYDNHDNLKVILKNFETGIYMYSVKNKKNIDEIREKNKEFLKNFLNTAKGIQQKTETPSDSNVSEDGEEVYGNIESNSTTNLDDLQKGETPTTETKNLSNREKTVDAIKRYIDYIKEHSTFDEDKHEYYIDGKKVDYSVTQYIEKLNNRQQPEDDFLFVRGIGHSMDSYLRDFFEKEKKDIFDKNKKYPNISQADKENLYNQCEKLKNKLDDIHGNGEYTVITTPFTIAANVKDKDGNIVSIAGTMDLIVVDKNGDVFIYDLKTKRHNYEVSNIDKADYPMQINAYRQILKTILPDNINVKNGGLIWFKTDYPDPDSTKKYIYDAKTKQVTVKDSDKEYKLEDFTKFKKPEFQKIHSVDKDDLFNDISNYENVEVEEVENDSNYENPLNALSSTGISRYDHAKAIKHKKALFWADDKNVKKYPEGFEIYKILEDCGAYDFVDNGYLYDYINYCIKNKLSLDDIIRYIKTSVMVGEEVKPVYLLAINADSVFFNDILSKKQKINIDGKNYQVVGMLSYNKTQVENNNTKKEYDKITRLIDSELQDVEVGKFKISKLTNGVSNINAGRLVNTQNSEEVAMSELLKNIDDDDIIFGAYIENNKLIVRDDDAEKEIVQVKSNGTNTAPGSTYIHIKCADGKYYPRQIRAKKIKASELTQEDLENDSFIKEIKDLFFKVCDSSLADNIRVRAKRELQSYIVFNNKNLYNINNLLNFTNTKTSNGHTLYILHIGEDIHKIESESKEELFKKFLEVDVNLSLRLPIKSKVISKEMLLKLLRNSSIVHTNVEMRSVNCNFELYTTDDSGKILKDETVNTSFGSKKETISGSGDLFSFVKEQINDLCSKFSRYFPDEYIDNNNSAKDIKSMKIKENEENKNLFDLYINGELIDREKYDDLYAIVDFITYSLDRAQYYKSIEKDDYYNYNDKYKMFFELKKNSSSVYNIKVGEDAVKEFEERSMVLYEEIQSKPQDTPVAKKPKKEEKKEEEKTQGDVNDVMDNLFGGQGKEKETSTGGSNKPTNSPLNFLQQKGSDTASATTEAKKCQEK